jgi:anthranilate phosphoribosyltransferase
LDELSISAPTRLVHVSPEGLREERVSPEDVGLSTAPRQRVQVDSLEAATTLAREVISGKEAGPARDMTLLSAAMALVVAGASESLAEAVARAREALSSGRAQHTLDRLIALSA